MVRYGVLKTGKQKKQERKMTEEKHNVVCDLETGMCRPAGKTQTEQSNLIQKIDVSQLKKAQTELKTEDKQS